MNLDLDINREEDLTLKAEDIADCPFCGSKKQKCCQPWVLTVQHLESEHGHPKWARIIHDEETNRFKHNGKP